MDHDEVVVRERLQGRDGAVAGIAFGCFALACLAARSIGELKPMEPSGLSLLGGVAISELTVMLMVIHQTWRQTLLTVRCNEMLLAFTSPMYRRHYRWTGDAIADMILIETANNDTDQALAELLITRVAGGEIHLFTDHPASEIRSLLMIVLPMLREGRSVSDAATDAATVEAADPGVNAMQTSGRLIDLHRELRKKQ